MQQIWSYSPAPPQLSSGLVLCSGPHLLTIACPWEPSHPIGPTSPTSPSAGGALGSAGSTKVSGKLFFPELPVCSQHPTLRWELQYVLNCQTTVRCCPLPHSLSPMLRAEAGGTWEAVEVSYSSPLQIHWTTQAQASTIQTAAMHKCSPVHRPTSSNLRHRTCMSGQAKVRQVGKCRQRAR